MSVVLWCVVYSCISSTITLGKGSFGFSFLVPRHLSTSQGVLDLGGVLALADEISTVLLCCEDKTHRAGVSVSLSGEILKPEGLKAGETVWVESCISKVGAALGFAEVTWNVETWVQSSMLFRGHIEFRYCFLMFCICVKVLMWESSEKSVLLARVSHIKYMKTGGMM